MDQQETYLLGKLDEDGRRYGGAVEFFGPDADLRQITKADVKRYALALKSLPNGMGGTISAQTQLHRLTALSNLYKHAAEDGYVPDGYNPCRFSGKPSAADREEADFLEETRLTPSAGREQQVQL